MKLFYFGSVCAPAWFDQTVQKSRVKPSASAQSFEMALIDGFSKNPEIELTVASAESVAMFPGGKQNFFKTKRGQPERQSFSTDTPGSESSGNQTEKSCGRRGKAAPEMAERKSERAGEMCVCLWTLSETNRNTFKNLQKSRL